MIDLLDELTEIPFDLFWDKWQELKPSICNRERAEQTWFYMHENDRVEAFQALAKKHPMIQICREPYVFLSHFDMKFGESDCCQRCGEYKKINGVSGYCDDCRPKNR